MLGATALAVRERSRARQRSTKPKSYRKFQASVKVEKRSLHKSGDVLSTGTLPVGDGFELYYEEHGHADGIPAVFLHGGPGAGCSRRMAQLFDPAKYRIILFDQRGCGKSTRKDSSSAEEQIDDNTTWHLVSDLEALREHLKIDRWVVAGGSWGTCLALAYASKFREAGAGYGFASSGSDAANKRGCEDRHWDKQILSYPIGLVMSLVSSISCLHGFLERIGLSF